MREQVGITLALDNLKLGYKERVLYEGINLEFKPQALTAIIGRNGCGKSTLLRSLAAIDMPLEGQVKIGSEGLFRPLHTLEGNERARLVSFVSTERLVLSNLKVQSVVGFGLAPYTDIFGRMKPEHHDIVTQSLDMVGMGSFATKSIDTLSDGERQRVMIARALAQQTPIIILDEPTAFLDLPNKYEISSLLSDLAHKMHKTVIFTTHDLDAALELCDRFVVIEGGCFVEGSPLDIVRDGCIERMLGASIRYLGHRYEELMG